MPIPHTERTAPGADRAGAVPHAHRRAQARVVPAGARGGLLLLDPRRGALPRERLRAARLGLAGRRARSPSRSSRSTSCCFPEVITSLADEERGLILVTGTTGSGKSTTLAAMIDHINSHLRQAHRHDRGPGRVPPPRQAVHHQPARGRRGHRLLRPRAAPGAAPGPGRDPHRRDARRGDGAHGAVRGRDRPPRALDDPHGGRLRVRQPHHRLLRPGRAAPGARHARRHAQGRDLPAARAVARRRSAACPPARCCG